MMPEPLTLVCPSAGPRLRDVIETALCDLPVRNAQDDLRGARILFALDAGSAGMDEPTLRLLRRLRTEPDCLDGSVCGFVVDGETELYTKALAQDLALAANLAGAALPGKPLVEGTGSLYNQHILAARRGMSWEETYRARTRELGERLLAFSPKRVGRPKLLVLHASESGRSSTLWMGRELSRRLCGCCSIAEISLRNGTIHDCRGCSYSACLHFARSGSCFYGGAISETVLPAIRECDAMLFLCPNYNDAAGANFTALFNRLTSLLLQCDLSEKQLYSVIVSGYSGGDLVARQLLGAMCLNKTVSLPPRFCLLETANDLPTAQALPGIAGRLDAFAAAMQRSLCQPAGNSSEISPNE